MFPAKTVGIIGINGKMAQNIYVPLFTQAGLTVIGSDKRNPSGLSNAQVLANSEVVLFSILPLAEVATEMRRLMPNARSKTLWLHGSSVQEVRDNPIGEILQSQALRMRGVDTGFVHFMIAPTVRSLRGQSVVYGFPQELLNPEWETWLLNLLIASKVKLTEKTTAEHDELTKAAQVLPMILAVAVGMVWQRAGIDVTEMLRVAGAPAKLQAFGALRSLGQPAVVSEILTEHPGAPVLLDLFAEVFADLSQMIKKKDTVAVANEMKQAQEAISPETLTKSLSITDWLVRLLGDLNGGAVGFEFSKPENVIGLLAEALGCFDRRGINKTTTTAQTTPDGKAQFLIGVVPEVDELGVRQAVEEVLTISGASRLENEFTF